MQQEDDDGFEIEDDTQKDPMTFTVKNESKEEVKEASQLGGNQTEGGVDNMMSNFGNFFTKKAVLDLVDEKQASMFQEMDKMDTLYTE